MTCSDGPRSRTRAASVLLGILVVALSTACAAPGTDYSPPERYHLERFQPILDRGPQIEQGRPSAVIDGLNHYVLSLPTKLILWNWQALDHELPQRSRHLLEGHLQTNGLADVKVRHNQYAPLAEWRRLHANRNVGAGYRYTLGLLSWLQYTILPGRLLAGLPLIGSGDHFNPYSNTIHVYSSDPTVLLHEAGHAKDYIPHVRRGSGFVLPRLIPGVDLIQEASASSDAIHYLQCAQERDVELRAYRTLYPAYATYVGGYVPGGILLWLPVVVSGHVVGRVQSSMRGSEIEREAYLAKLGNESLPPAECPAPVSP